MERIALLGIEEVAFQSIPGILGIAAT